MTRFAWWQDLHETYVLARNHSNDELLVSALPANAIPRAEQALSLLTDAKADEITQPSCRLTRCIPSVLHRHSFTTSVSLDNPEH